MTIQIVMGFATDKGKSGAWDEVYFTNSDSVETAQLAWQGNNLDTLSYTRNSVGGRRMACMADDCYNYYNRYSEVGARGGAILAQGKVFGYRGDENMASDAVAFTVKSASRNTKREVRLGGLPDSWIDGGELADKYMNGYIGVLGTPAANTFMQAWKDAGGVINFRDTPLGGADSYQIIGASKPSQYGPITLTLATQRSWDTRIPVSLTCRGQPQMRNIWKISTYANPSGGPYTVTLSGSERVSCPTSFNGMLTVVTKAGVAIVNQGAAFLTPHKLGKKKFQRRGRQSVKLLRH